MHSLAHRTQLEEEARLRGLDNGEAPADQVFDRGKRVQMWEGTRNRKAECENGAEGLQPPYIGA